MTAAIDFGSITVDSLRRIGGVKWTAFPDTIGAFIAEMDFGVDPVITKALHDTVDLGLFGYLPTAVSDAMSGAVAAWQQQTYGWQLRPDQVHPLPDVLKGLEVAIDHYSEKDAPVIMPTPAYMPFFGVPKFSGRKIIEVPMTLVDGRYQLDLDGIDRAFQAGGSLLVLCNPYNPVGRVFSRTELVALSEVVIRNGGRVFSDEIHAPLVFAPNTHIPYASLSAETAGHTVTATSASKAWNLPGLKCAQLIISNDADAEMWEEVGFMASHGASNPGVVANTAAFSSGRPWLDQVLDYLDGNRKALGDLLAERLPGVGYTPPEGTYIGWLDCRQLGLGDHPAEFFREKAGVALTDGIDCGGPGAGFVRFVFATARPIIEQAVAQMADALQREGIDVGVDRR